METASRKKVALIADDEEGIREYLGNLLKRRGFAIDTAENGKVALEKVSQNKPDIIILDFAMPEMDGLQVLNQLKAQPYTQDIPVIFCSAYKHIKDITKDLPGAAVKYLEKPCNIKFLLEQIESLS